jgi:hypothetical protein
MGKGIFLNVKPRLGFWAANGHAADRLGGPVSAGKNGVSLPQQFSRKVQRDFFGLMPPERSGSAKRLGRNVG